MYYKRNKNKKDNPQSINFASTILKNSPLSIEKRNKIRIFDT